MNHSPGILVVDDEASVRTLLETALSRQGYSVWVACNGAEALSVYDSHRQEIALVLMDVRMPILDGPETLQALRQKVPDVQCCIMSGQSGKYTDEQIAALGAAHVFHKPFRLIEVLDVLERLTGGPHPAGDN
jgi:CheY-like chemotaxis protein